MCGIIAAFNHDDNNEPVNDWIINQYEDQCDRGSDGFGIVRIAENMKYELDRATEPYKFMFDLHKDKSKMMLVHHRYPTSSPNKISQTHPIEVDNGSLKHKYLVVHNGVIYNTEELYKKHTEELGFTYATKCLPDSEKFNDSECLAIEVARLIEGQSDIINAQGSAAFIALQINKKTNKATHVFFGRNSSNPLHMSKTRGKLRLSSEGEGDNIKENTLYSCNLKDFELSKKNIKFAERQYATTYSRSSYQSPYQQSIGFEHKDDKDVPTVDDEIDDTIDARRTELEQLIDEFFEQLTDPIWADEADYETHFKAIKHVMTEAAEDIKKIQAHNTINSDVVPDIKVEDEWSLYHSNIRV